MTTEEGASKNALVGGEPGAVGSAVDGTPAYVPGSGADEPRSFEPSGSSAGGRELRGFTQISNYFDLLKSVVDHRSSNSNTTTRRPPSRAQTDRDLSTWENEGGSGEPGAASARPHRRDGSGSLAMFARIGAALKAAWLSTVKRR